VYTCNSSGSPLYSNTYDASNNTINVTGLSSGTSYIFYIRAQTIGSGTVSAPFGPIILNGELIYTLTYSGSSSTLLSNLFVATNTGVLVVSNATAVSTGVNTYLVTISFTFTDDGSTSDGINFTNVRTFYSNNVTNLNITQFGSIPLSRNPQQFYALFNSLLTFSAVDTPTILSNTSFLDIFSNNYNFNANINAWDVSNVINMQSAFEKCYNYNSPLNSWNVSNVTNMSRMFYQCAANYAVFDPSLNNWNVSKVTNMFWMFRETTFNGVVSNWNTSNVTSMERMFQSNSIFNSNISYDPINNYWNTSKVISFDRMFLDTNSFNNGAANGNTTTPLNWIINTVVTIPISGMSTNSNLTPVSNTPPGNATTVNAVGFEGTTLVICYING
jgi:surface protein